MRVDARRKSSSSMPPRNLTLSLERDKRINKARRLAATTYRRFTGGMAAEGTATFMDDADDSSDVQEAALSRAQTLAAEDGVRVTDLVVEDRDWSTLEGEVFDAEHLDERFSQDGHSEAGDNYSRTGLSSENWTTTLRFSKDAIQRFLSPRFANPRHEAIFCKEAYAAKKGAAMGMSLFFVLNWLLYLSINFGLDTFSTGTLYSKICYYGICTFFTVPLPILIAFDAPTKFYYTFQAYLLISSFLFGYIEIIQTRLCGFWADHLSCDKKDFLLMSFCDAIPALSLFILQARAFTCIGAALAIILMAIFDLPVTQGLFSRVFVNLFLFYCFILAGHYVGENRERRLFRINMQLKNAYRAQQKAQAKESEAFASKRRFISYIFHEVRVPLNTAFIAYQNLHANHAFKDDGDNETEIDALEGSMLVMSKVLDDVLDIQRMDAGRFENCSEPFELHKSVQMTLASVKAAALAKTIRLDVKIDPEIDKLAQGREHLWVIGDSTRLRQVLSNLASNALKFTPEGGAVSISADLLRKFECGESTPVNVKEAVDMEKEEAPPRSTRTRVVIRFAVNDTGPGIDLSSGRTPLFIPFSQTQFGKSFGSKGSGLGLAIVRQIVKLSGGRVGVSSDPINQPGTTFWFELAFWVATETEIVAMEQRRIRAKSPNGDSGPARPDKNRLGSFESASPKGSARLTPCAEFVGDSNPAEGYMARRALGRTQSSPLIPMHGHKPGGDSNAPLSVPTAAVDFPLPVSVIKKVTLQTKDRWNVLAADDDPLTRKLMTRLLERLGCDVTTAADGQIALDILLGTETAPPRRFDVIFLDNQMPFKNGPVVVAALRSAGRNDLVVGITGNALRDDQEDYLAHGADHVLTKPVMQADLRRFLKLASAHPKE